MKLAFLPSLCFLGMVLSSPLEPAAKMSIKRQFAYEQLSFIFSSGPARYDFTFPADGATYNIHNNLSVSLIYPGSFDVLDYCNFYYKVPTGAKLPVLSATGKANEYAVGPPAPIVGVSCEPTGQNGQCLPFHADCQWCSLTGGCYLLNCCSGYCAAGKCRDL